MSIRLRPAVTRLATLASFLLLDFACTPQKAAEHPIVRMAPFDLDCPKEQLAYAAIDSGTWGVTGCCKRVKYIKLCRQTGFGMASFDSCRWVQN
jgi:hypothetical protein